MHAALYGVGGYYASGRDTKHDYATSPQVHPAFGALIATHLAEMWRSLGEPSVFTVIELGAGDGCLMLDIRDAVNAGAFVSDLLERFERALEYFSFDAYPRSENVKTDEHLIKSITGCVLSNELLDAFPTHRFVVRGGKALEVYVKIEDGRLMYVHDTASTPAIEERVGEFAGVLPDGYMGEVNLGIGGWAEKLESALERGYVLTIDYGHPREALYHPSRVEGSLRCYKNHVLNQNPLHDVGSQDITAHVDFTALDCELRARGFSLAAPLKSQRDFLREIGIDEYISAVRRKLGFSVSKSQVSGLRSDLTALNALIDPRGLGSFLVAQHRVNAPELPLQEANWNVKIPLAARSGRHLMGI